jgi:hypothetical protein
MVERADGEAVHPTKNVHLQHSIPHYETTYRNLKKPEPTGRIEEFIFRYLKFHQTPPAISQGRGAKS